MEPYEKQTKLKGQSFGWTDGEEGNETNTNKKSWAKKQDPKKLISTVWNDSLFDNQRSNQTKIYNANKVVSISTEV